MKPLNVAIIGANGFIAGHLIRQLRGNNRVNLHLFGRNPAGAFGNEFHYSSIDFQDDAKLQRDFEGTDVVYHMASDTIPSTSWDDPMIEIQKNLIPFTRFMNVISHLGVKKVAFISSAGTVYGTTRGKVTETSDKNPFSPYGIMKLTMEHMLNYYKSRFNINHDVYRVSNVYGPGQDTRKGLGIINTFLEKIVNENKVTIFGDGHATRNYIYAEDVARLLQLSIHDTASSNTFNLSSNSTHTINELVAILKKTVSEAFDVVHEKGRQSDNSYIDLDNSRILAASPGFSFTGIEDGISKTYSGIKNQIKN
jgi:UDP-glucose 4-epimerase